MKIEQNIILSGYTSWLIGGSADYFCLPENESDVQEALQFAIQKKIPWTALGGGSNVLISDQGIRGLVICLRKFTELSLQNKPNEIVIQCLSGTAKSELLKTFLKYKLQPALFLAGLPGDVGGGIVMNAGVAENFIPKEFSELIRSFDVLKIADQKIIKKNFLKNDVNWRYRHSEGWQPGIITSVELAWPNQPDVTILDQVKKANLTRLSKQPLDMPSCGSVFMNPEGFKAAQLIDGCGL